ncbi:MAG: tetratricopeptide repeat protein [Chloroflexi bacterium]|nr:tetratricopeptide repeat protein [Chloroflexota bacterium]
MPDTLETILSGPSIIRKRWLPTEAAVQEIVAFEQRLGPKHLWLACHAALPLILTPELVNLIHINFLDRERIPWIAEIDFLLSPLCRPIDEDQIYYEVEPSVREVLLVELENRFGWQRPLELSNFLLTYLVKKPNWRQRPDVTRTHKWIAQAYISPDQVVEEMSVFLAEGLFSETTSVSNLSGQIQIAMMVEVASGPLERTNLQEEYQYLVDNASLLSEMLYRDYKVPAEAIEKRIDVKKDDKHEKQLISPNLLQQAEKLKDSPTMQVDQKESSLTPIRAEILDYLEKAPIALVVGPLGVGKTWLGQQLVKRLQSQKHHIFRVSGTWVGGEEEYLLFSLAEFLSAREQPALLRVLHRERENPHNVRPEKYKLALLSKLFANFPVFIWIDDLQEIPEESFTFRLIYHLVENRPDQCSILLTSRIVPANWLDKSDRTIIRLTGLTEEEVKLWMSQGLNLSEDQIRLIYECTRGVPLILHYFLTNVKMSGLESALDMLAVASPIDDLFRFFCNQILNALSTDARIIINLLSLLQRSEETDFIIQCSKAAKVQDPGQIIRNLQNQGIATCNQVSFSHPLFKDYVRNAMDMEQHKSLHRQIASVYMHRAIEKNASDDWLEASFHFWEAGQFERAATALIELARELPTLSSVRRLLTALEKFSKSQLEDNILLNVLEIRSRIAFQLGQYDRAVEDYVILHNITTDPRWLLHQGRIEHLRGQFNTALRLLDDVLAMTENEILQSQARIEKGRIYSLLGETQKSIQMFKDSVRVFHLDLEEAETANLRRAEIALGVAQVQEADRDTAAWALRHAGLAYIQSGQVAAAIACWASAQYLWRRLGDMINAAAMQVNLGAVNFDFGIDIRKAEKYLDEARQVLEEQEALYDLTRVYNNLAIVYYRRFRFNQALQISNHLLEMAMQGFPVQRSDALDVRGAIYTAMQRWEEAEGDFMEAVQLSNDIKQLSGQRRSLSNLGLLYVNWGRTLESLGKLTHAQEKYRQARQLFVQSLKLMETPQAEAFPVEVAETRTSLAEVLIRMGQPDEAVVEIDQVARFAKSGASPFFVHGKILRVWGELLWQRRDLSMAEEKLLAAWHVLTDEPERVGRDMEESIILKDLAMFYREIGQNEKAYEYESRSSLLNILQQNKSEGEIAGIKPRASYG